MEDDSKLRVKAAGILFLYSAALYSSKSPDQIQKTNDSFDVRVATIGSSAVAVVGGINYTPYTVVDSHIFNVIADYATIMDLKGQT